MTCPRLARALALALAVAAPVLLWSPEVRAVYQCGNQKDDCKCNKNNPYPCCSNGGNCTWWAWEAACCNWKVGLPGWGNANQWAGNAKANPSYDVKSSPVAGSIAVRVSGSYGHVAWVKSVSGSSIVVSEMACWGFYGMRTHTYSASYFDGGFIVRKGACACTSGAKQTQACGNCGTQSRTCASSCQWGSWSSCSGEGPCAKGKKESRACGNCGTQSRTCSSKCQWGSWSSCAGQGVCTGGKKESRTCGLCGTQTRTCSSKCAWGSWSSCAGQGVCTPGKKEYQGCDPSGIRTRTCNTSCQWSSWGPCSPRDSGVVLPDGPLSDAPLSDGPPSDAFTADSSDADGFNRTSRVLSGGCQISRTGDGALGGILAAALTLLLLLLLRIRRKKTPTA